MKTLSEEQRIQWATDGYIVLEGALNPSEVAFFSDVFETRCLVHDFNHVLSVVFPVCRHVEDTFIKNKLLTNHFSELKLYDTALVVTLFVPWVWEEQL